MTHEIAQSGGKKIGTVRIAPDILTTVVEQTVRGIGGVVRTVAPTTPSAFERLFNRTYSHTPGVQVAVDEGKVNVELYIVATRSATLRDLGETVRTEVSRALRLIVGMPVGHINVHIQDVE